MTEQECGARRVVTGVNLTCNRIRGHKGPHASASYGTRWRDSGEVLPPVAPPRPKSEKCPTADCTLWPDHAGPHGRQESLSLDSEAAS